MEHEDLVSLDDPDGIARLDEGKGLVERGKRHANLVALRQQVSRKYRADDGVCPPTLIYPLPLHPLSMLSFTASDKKYGIVAMTKPQR